ncbi:MAG: type II toxin-antitoxin system PemK/MazF family toxin [Ruminococcus flavefaciens]|nr:type II toxin-antitoxin system PemK/MazF family toxin [Ruminococcus flavefaciens]
MDIRRGDIYYADLAPVVGSEQGGTRPVLIIQNDTGNRHSSTVIAAAITSRQGKKPLPTHIRMGDNPCRLGKESTVLLEQVRTIDRARLKEYIGRADRATMQDVDHAIAVSFGLDGMFYKKDTQAETIEQKGETYGRQETGMGLLFN